MATASPATNRVLTVPNVVTIVRLACIPLFLWLLFGLVAGIGLFTQLASYSRRHLEEADEWLLRRDATVPLRVSIGPHEVFTG